MKRILSLVAATAVSLALAAGAHAQFGFILGLTSSSVRLAEADAISLYHAGVTARIPMGSGFALQPSLLYQVKGANVGHLSTASEEDFKLKTGFVELPISLQWGPTLAAFRPFVLAEPFVGYRVTSGDKGSESFQDWAQRAKRQFEYGFGLGGGLEIAEHVQLSAQWFNNLGPMFSGAAEDEGEVELDEVKNFQGIKFSLAIIF